MRTSMIGSMVFAGVVTCSMVAAPAFGQGQVRDHRRHPAGAPGAGMKPMVRAMTPKVGREGETVTLRGRFSDDVEVYFGSMKVTPTASNHHQIQFTVPQVKPGKHRIRVKSAAGEVMVGAFMVAGPTGEPPGHITGHPMPPPGDHDGDHDMHGDHGMHGDHRMHGGAPMVTDYWPRKGPPGTPVTITGRRFGPGWTIIFGNHEVKPAHRNAESLSFKVPPGEETAVIVLRRGRYDIPVGRFTVAKGHMRDERAAMRQRWRADAQKYWRMRQAKLAKDVKARRAALEREEMQLARQRDQRRHKRLAELRRRWQAAFLARPEVRAELSLHANRSARLARMQRLAETGNYGKLAVRIHVLKDREDARHKQRMADLKMAYARR